MATKDLLYLGLTNNPDGTENLLTFGLDAAAALATGTPYYKRDADIYISKAAVGQDLQNVPLQYDFVEQPGLEAFEGRGPTLDFTRATTATFTDQDNIIRTANSGEPRFTGQRRVENLVLQSQDLSTTWTNFGTVITTNINIAPDGTLTADSLEDDNASTFERIQQLITVPDDSETYTISLYVKKTSGGTAPHVGVNFNLTGGSQISSSIRLNPDNGDTGGTANVIDEGDYWRVWDTGINNSSGNTTMDISIYPAASLNNNFSDDAAAIGTNTIWGIQLEKTSGQLDLAPSEYLATTTTSVSQYYTTERRTNTLLYSQDLSQSSVWDYNNLTATADDAIAPDGTNTATRLETASPASNPNVQQDLSGTAKNFANRLFECSLWVKGGNVTEAVTQIFVNGGNPGATPHYNARIVEGPGTITNATSEIQLSDLSLTEWTHVAYQAETVSPTGNLTFYVKPPITSPVVGDYIHVWGTQVTQATGNLEYIPTTSTVESSDWEPIVGVPRLDTNLAVQSEDFNTSWTVQRLTVSSNTTETLDPIGGYTADKFTEDGTAAQSHRVFSPTINSTSNSHTFSVYAKNVDRDWVRLRMDGVVSRNAWFNLSTGTVGTVESQLTARIRDTGNGWYRCSITVDEAALASNAMVALADADGNVTYNGDSTSSIYVWGAQFEEYPEATEYISTTTVPVSDWRYTLPLGYLNEEARTNICLQSRDLSTTWVNTRSVDTQNYAVAPDGTNTANRLIDDSTTGTNSVVMTQNVSMSTATGYVLSMYAKADQLDWFHLRMQNIAAQDLDIYYDLTDGAVGASVGTDSTFQFIEDAGNGWWRCGFGFVTDSADGDGTITIGVAEGDEDNSVDLDGTSSILVWGAQLEVGAMASSYIPTTTTSVTRNADRMTSSNISWFNTPGTLYSRASTNGVDSGLSEVLMIINDGTDDDRYLQMRTSSDVSTIRIDNATVIQSSIVGQTYLKNAFLEQVSIWDTDDFSIYTGGIEGTTDTSGTPPSSMSQFAIGSNRTGGQVWNGHIAEIKFYNVRQSDTFAEGLSLGLRNDEYNTENTNKISVKDFSFNRQSQSTLIGRSTLDPNERRGITPHISAISPVNFSFTTYIDPILDTNVTSSEEYLWTSLMGNDTVASNTIKSEIDFADGNVPELHNLTLWFNQSKYSDNSYRIDNAVVDSAEISFGINEIAEIKWRGRALSITEDITIPNATDRTSPGCLKNKLSTISVNMDNTNYNLALTGGNVRINNNNTFYGRVKMGETTVPTGHYTGKRVVDGNLNFYLKTGTSTSLDLFNELLNNASNADYEDTHLANITVNIGGNNTPLVTLNIPETLLNIGQQDFKEVLALNVPFVAKEDTTNYMSVIYKA